MSGGGGSAPEAVKYESLERLYDEQAANAALLRNLSQKYLPGAIDSYAGIGNKVLDPGYVRDQEQIAAADMAKSNALERQATERQLSGMGVNANDPRFAGSLRGTELNNAARMAAGVNSTRDAAKRYQLAVAQDQVGTLTGTNNSAASQMGAATSGLASMYNNQQAQANATAQNQSNNIANAVGGIYAMMMKDGGQVPGLAMLAGGGITGGNTFAPPAPVIAQPQRQQPQQPGAAPQQMMRFGKSLANLDNKLGNLGELMQGKGASLMDNAGNLVGKLSESAGRELQSFSAGMRLSPDQARSAADAYMSAARDAKAVGDLEMAKVYEHTSNSIRNGAQLESITSNPAIAPEIAGPPVPEIFGPPVPEAASLGTVGEAGSVATGTAGTVGAVGEGTAVAGTAATAAEGAGAMTSALGAVSSAIPWIGAAVAIGSAFDMFADGGKVGGKVSVKTANRPPVQDMRVKGGKVKGHWRENRDTRPALLVPDEHVINAEAAAIAGHDRLESLNRAGLKARSDGKTPKDIRREQWTKHKQPKKGYRPW